MRYSTKLRLEYCGILLLFYGGCTLGTVFVARSIIASLTSGEIRAGRYGGTILHLATEPVRYWLALGLHVLVATVFIGMICYFARSMEHGPWRRRR